MDAVQEEAARCLGLDAVVGVRGRAGLRGAWDVDALATGAVAAFGDALVALRGGAAVVDAAAVARWFHQAVTPVGWTVPSPWDPIAGDYRSSDGWIRLHTNAPRHRDAALRVLEVSGERDAVAAAVAHRVGEELESAVVAAGGAAAVLRDAEGWRVHPQGAAVAEEALIARTATGAGARRRSGDPERPLAGVRVLDLTRVIAGPVAGRALAAYGAEVLRIDPPDWAEPALEPDLTLGKRTARLDARTADGRARLLALLAEADVLLHGYRRDALEGLGLGEAVRRRLRPGLVEVALTAYGWTGPWTGRRGFDSLVQMSAGIAARGSGEAGRPVPLPVQALDHATGWLMAAAAVAGLREERGSTARLSLARTAVALRPAATAGGSAVAEPAGERIGTPWGDAVLAPPPLEVEGAAFRFDVGPMPLGSGEARWRG